MSLLIKNCWYCFVLPFSPPRKSAGYYFFCTYLSAFPFPFSVFVVAKFTCIFGTREMINKGWIHLVQHVISFVPFGDWGTPLPEPFVSFFLPIRSITVQFNMVKKRQKLLYYQSFPNLWYIFFLLRHCERGETIFKKRRSLFFILSSSLSFQPIMLGQIHFKRLALRDVGVGNHVRGCCILGLFCALKRNTFRLERNPCGVWWTKAMLPQCLLLSVDGVKNKHDGLGNYACKKCISYVTVITISVF